MQRFLSPNKGDVLLGLDIVLYTAKRLEVSVMSCLTKLVGVSEIKKAESLDMVDLKFVSQIRPGPFRVPVRMVFAVLFELIYRKP